MIDDPRQRLKQIKEHRNDHTWLTENLEYVYIEVKGAVQRPPLLQDGVDTLLDIYDFLLTLSDIERWMWILTHAMLEMLNLKDGERLVPIWEKVGKTNHWLGKPAEAIAAFNNGLARAQEQNRLQDIVNAYVGLFKAQLFRQVKDFCDDQVQHAISIAKLVGDPKLEPSLYQAITFAYNYRGDAHKAIQFGQMAYVSLHHHDNTLELARTAFTVAVAFRTKRNFQLAENWLERARVHYATLNDPKQYGLIPYEQGEWYKAQEDYATAKHCLKEALSEFERLQTFHNKQYYIAMTRHSLGIVQTYLAEYDDAEENLLAAQAAWEAIGNVTEQANIAHALGFMETRRGDKQAAEKHLHRALAICAQLPDMGLRERIETAVRVNFSELV